MNKHTFALMWLAKIVISVGFTIIVLMLGLDLVKHVTGKGSNYISKMYDKFECVDGTVWTTIVKSDGSKFTKQALEDGVAIKCKKLGM